MSQIIKIIKENELNIPIGTILHFQSFHHEPNGNCWKSVCYYIYEDSSKILHTIRQEELYPKFKDIYKNIILMDNLQLGQEGEEYWKVFTSKKESYFHKLEFINGKYFPAICYTPYRDIIKDNTNSYQPTFQRRFKTEIEASIFIESIPNNIKREEL